MHKVPLTAEVIEECIEDAIRQAGLGDIGKGTIKNGIRAGIYAALKRVGRSALAAEPSIMVDCPPLCGKCHQLHHGPCAEPDRTGQWFVDITDGKAYGPVGYSYDGCHYETKGDECCWFNETNISDGDVLRIPPRPNDRVTECGEPKKGEKFYARPGSILCEHLGRRDEVSDHPDYGRRRWIEPEPEPELVWPVGPFTVTDLRTGTYATVHDANGALICGSCTQAEAEAIALALTLTPECVALDRQMQQYQPFAGVPQYPERQRHRDLYAARDALIARWDAAGFKMPTK